MHSHVDGRGICSTNADQERAAPASERFACRTGDAAIYSKPAELQAALVEAHFNLDMRGPLEASLTRVVLGGIRLLRVEENGPRQAIVTLPQDRAVIAFPTEGARRQAWEGVMVRSGGLIFFGPGARFRHSMAGRGAWAWIVAEPQSINQWRRIFSGWEPGLPRSSSILRPSRKAFARLARLHQEAAYLSVREPEIVGHQEVIRSLEQELIHAIVTVLASQDP